MSDQLSADVTKAVKDLQRSIIASGLVWHDYVRACAQRNEVMASSMESKRNAIQAELEANRKHLEKLLALGL